MRIIKLGLISLVVFALLITGFSLFFPSHVRISKAMDINADKDSTWQLIADPANWRKWYPGADSLFPIMKDQTVKGIGDADGDGLVLAAVTDSTVTAAHKGAGFKRSESGWNYYPGHKPGSFTIQWYMDFHLRWYPWEKFSSLLLEKRFGTMMEYGLEKLRRLAETGDTAVAK